MGLERERRRARLGDFRGEAQMTQNPLNHRRLLDQRDQPEPSAAARTRQHVKANVRRIRSAQRNAPGRGELAIGWSPSGAATSVEADSLTAGERACSTTWDRHAARGASTP